MNLIKLLSIGFLLTNLVLLFVNIKGLVTIRRRNAETEELFKQFKAAASLFRAICTQAYFFHRQPQLTQMFKHFFSVQVEVEDDDD